jgi:hypothetical protein
MTGRWRIASALWWFTVLSPVPLVGSVRAESQQATIVAGEIVRDSGTVRDIARTSATQLSKGMGYRLVVSKSRYRLNVFEGDSLVRALPVALGSSPIGPKESRRHEDP